MAGRVRGARQLRLNDNRQTTRFRRKIVLYNIDNTRKLGYCSSEVGQRLDRPAYPRGAVLTNRLGFGTLAVLPLTGGHPIPRFAASGDDTRKGAGALPRIAVNRSAEAASADTAEPEFLHVRSKHYNSVCIQYGNDTPVPFEWARLPAAAPAIVAAFRAERRKPNARWTDAH
jgi:hypothetical protein